MVAKRAITKEKVMASLYKKDKIWYVSTYVNGTRISKSLKTKERKKAFAKMPSTLSNILQQSNHLIET